MKLNLLPTTEKKSRQGKTAIVLAMLIVAGSLAGAAALTLISKSRLETSKDGIEDLATKVANVDATSKKADEIIATAAEVIRNAQLSKAMIDHNDVYPKLYDDLKRYIPPYYRIQTMTATPLGEGVSRITLVGTLTGYQRYADLMLALMRFKDAQTIIRSGYNLTDPTVPALDVTDQFGKPRKVEEGPIPDDGLQRLAYFQAKASAAPKGYLATGAFGSGTDEVRGPLPTASLVTIQMDVARDLRVPLAADTLRPTAGAAGGAAIPGVPGVPGAAAPGPNSRGD